MSVIDYLQTSWPYLRYIFLAVGGYLISILVKHLLDKKVTKFRIDNYILYLFVSKTPLVSTKIIFTSKERPNINNLKDSIEKTFNLEQNEKVKNNSYLFKIKDHPTPMKFTIIESENKKPYTITLETFGNDKLPKILKSSFDDTVKYFEKISNVLKSFNLSKINVQVKISSYFDEKKDKITYYYGDSKILTSKTIQVSSDNFTELGDLIKECLRIWRNKFI